MYTQRLNDWLQLAAAVGVLAGLLLVTFELRQEHALARAQLASDGMAGLQELRRSIRDEATAEAYVKAYESPHELTLEEQIILDSFYSEVISGVLARNMYMVGQGIFELVDLNANARGAAKVVFASNYGREWWAVRRASYIPQVRDLMDAAAEDGSGTSRFEDAALILDRIEQQMEQSQ